MVIVDNLRIGFAKAGDVILTHNATVGRVSELPEATQGTVVLSTSTSGRCPVSPIPGENGAVVKRDAPLAIADIQWDNQ